MPEFIIQTDAPPGAYGLPAQFTGEAAVAADQASEPADFRSTPCVGPAAARSGPRHQRCPADPGRRSASGRSHAGPKAAWQRTEDMQAATCHASTAALWADALFVSVLQRSDKPDAGQVRQAVVAAVRAYGDQGCAQRVAQEFGDHPETAVARMHWARAVARTMPGSPPGPAHGSPRHRPGPRPAGTLTAAIQGTTFTNPSTTSS